MRYAWMVLALLVLSGCAVPSGKTARTPPQAITEQQAYDIAYAAIAEKLGYEPIGRAKWKYWEIRRAQQDGRSVWRISVDLAPAGGGDHANAVVDAATGEVIHAQAGRHLR